MQKTTNYDLKKPEGSDAVNIDDLNFNADTLDVKLKTVETTAGNAKTTAAAAQSTADEAKTAAGTAQTTADQAKTAAAAAQSTADQAKHDAAVITSITTTLSHTAWDATAKTQTVAVTGVTADNNVIIGLAGTATDDQAKAAAKAGIRGITQAADSITFKCNTPPAVDIPLSVLVIG